MAAGLGAFGFSVGFVTGLSHVEGISQELLTSLFSFVGGVLLTWTGFKSRRVWTEKRSAKNVGHPQRADEGEANARANDEAEADGTATARSPGDSEVSSLDPVRAGSGLFFFSLALTLGCLGGTVVREKSKCWAWLQEGCVRLEVSSGDVPSERADSPVENDNLPSAAATNTGEGDEEPVDEAADDSTDEVNDLRDGAGKQIPAPRQPKPSPKPSGVAPGPGLGLHSAPQGWCKTVAHGIATWKKYPAESAIEMQTVLGQIGVAPAVRSEDAAGLLSIVEREKSARCP